MAAVRYNRYINLGDIMSELRQYFETYQAPKDIEKATLVDHINTDLNSAGYEVVEVNGDKPWGAYLRIANGQADKFVADFFPGLTPDEARLGVAEAELSPKILIVSPDQRLSWQYHDRRAERWMFLTEGAYNKSASDDPGELQIATSGDVVQFAQGERHRLVGLTDDYTLVAEIWQHTDTDSPSDEDDITRLIDDYSR